MGKDLTPSEEQRNYTQSDIDLMFWNYCIGLLDLANSALPSDDNFLLKMNSLADNRRLAIKRAFRTFIPSFSVRFLCSGSHFSLKQIE